MDAIRSSEDERLFREAQARMAQRTQAALDQARRRLAGILERCGEGGKVYIALAPAEHSYGLLLAGERFVEALEQARAYAEEASALDSINPARTASLCCRICSRQGTRGLRKVISGRCARTRTIRSRWRIAPTVSR